MVATNQTATIWLPLISGGAQVKQQIHFHNDTNVATSLIYYQITDLHITSNSLSGSHI